MQRRSGSGKAFSGISEIGTTVTAVLGLQIYKRERTWKCGCKLPGMRRDICACVSMLTGVTPLTTAIASHLELWSIGSLHYALVKPKAPIESPSVFKVKYTAVHSVSASVRTERIYMHPAAGL